MNEKPPAPPIDADLAESEAEFAAAFAEWDRRWKEDPDGFETEAEAMAKPSDESGDACARYFIKLLSELRRG